MSTSNVSLSNPKITVITPTVRPEGLEVVKKALKRQTFTDFEWIIVTSVSVIELDRILDHYPYKYVSEPPKDKEDVWTLNKAYNKAIANAKGELIVSWQDYTYAKPDTLEKFWFHYTQEPKTLVTGVGNKYQDDTWTVQTWKDPREREDQGTYYPCFFSDCEFNLCAVPTAAFYACGGFDESLDRYFGMDGYSVVDRLNMLGGWDFKIDQTIKSYSLEHGRPTDWDKKNALGQIYNLKRLDYLANARLGYLTLSYATIS